METKNFKGKDMHWFYAIQIRLLILFYPPKLFQKINQLSWYQKLLHEWINRQHFLPKSKILEVGCATGALSEYLFKHAYQPIGVDSSKRMIKVAKAHFESIEFQVANTYALPFEDNYFDAVVSASLINILPDRKKAILEMLRVCKVEGKVSILIPLKGFDGKSLELLQRELNLQGFSKTALTMWHKSAPKVSLEEVRALFESNGFHNIEMEQYLNGMIMTITVTKSSVI